MSPTTQKLYSLLSARVIKVLALVAVALFGLLLTGSVAFAGLPAKGVQKVSPQASPTSPPCTLTGAVVDNPVVYGLTSSFMAVSALAPNDVWAVGYHADSPNLTLTEHWDGTAWSFVASPSVGAGSNRLNGVKAISANDVWAVGQSADAAGPLIEHWNGTEWSVATVPSANNAQLLAVSAISANDVWAVGDYFNGTTQTLIEHWNGTIWATVASPNVGTYLTSVAAISANDVWAVGISANAGSVYQTLTEHWNGTTWSVVSSPDVGSGGNTLLGVTAVSSGDVWAVGEYGPAPMQTLIEHWNGTFWSVEASPSPSQYAVLNAITAVSANDIWAAGLTEPGSVGRSLVEHWDGSTWSVVDSPNSGSDVNQLNGIVALSATDIWTVGGYYSSPHTLALTEHFTSPCDTATATPTSTPQATATPDPCTLAGVIVANPSDNGLYDSFTAVDSLAANDVWAVGNAYDGQSFIRHTLTEHWNGTSWSIVPSPNVGSRSNELFGVAAISANDVWAVGYYDSSGAMSKTLIEHWDGIAWSVVSSPNAGSTENVFYGISANSASDIWAVGYFIGPHDFQTLTEHWDGTTWTVVSSPNVGTGNNVLQSVSASSATDVWAVGYWRNDFAGADPTPTRNLIAHWNGSVWSIVSSPNIDNQNNSLTGVSAVSANDVWAVGLHARFNNNPSDVTLIEHWNGRTWSIVSSPSVGISPPALNGITAISANNVWAVGVIDVSGPSSTVVEHWDGSTWSVVSSPNIGIHGGELNAVTLAPTGDLWAVGFYVDTSYELPLTEHFTVPCLTPSATATRTATVAVSATPTTDSCAITGAVVPSPNGTGVQNELLAVSALAPNDVWAVGYSGDNTNDKTLAEHWNGTAWTIVATPGQGSSSDRLRGVVAISANDVWAVASRYIEHWDGTSWSVVYSPPPGSSVAQFASIAATSSSDVWAVGNYVDSSSSLTLIEHWNGLTWSVVSSPNRGSVNSYLTGVSAVGLSDAWVVGWDTSGTLTEHWNGTTWSIVASANPGAESNAFVAVSARAINDVWAIGQTRDVSTQYATLIEHWNGTAWFVVPSPSPSATNNLLLGVVAISANDVWAVGGQDSPTTDDSLIEHWNGSSWSVVNNPIGLTEYAYSAVDATSSGDVWAVGVYQPSTNILTFTEHFTLPCITPTATPIITATPTPDPCAITGIVVQSPNANALTNTLESLSVLSPNDIWAVGDAATNVPHQTLIEHWNGTVWSIVPSPNGGSNTNNFLASVAAVSANDVWAVGYYMNAGDIGLIEHWDGSAWTIAHTIGGVQLASVSAISANDVWAVGQISPVTTHTFTTHWDGTAWSTVSSADVGSLSNHLVSVDAVSHNDVWAVGNYVGSGNSTQTLTEHWNGTAWSVVASPNVGTAPELLSVSGVSANDVWAVGIYSASGNVHQTLTEHWDGSAWSIVSSPTPNGSGFFLSVLAVSPSDVWAVGETQIGSNQKSLVEHWDGTLWSVVSVPSAGTQDTLYGVSASAGNGVWAVGSYFYDPASLTLTERFTLPCVTSTPTATSTSVLTATSTSTSVPSVTATATRTSTSVPSATPTTDPCAITGVVVQSPNGNANINNLTSVVAISANDVWAAGYYRATVDQTLIEHWDGTNWSIVSSPNVGSGTNDLNGIAAVSANDIWAVGYSHVGGTYQTLIEHWDGTVWSISKLGSPVSDAALNGVSALGANDIWAVGDIGDISGTVEQTLTIHWDGTTWSVVASPNFGAGDNILQSISARSANDAWAVGFEHSGSGTGVWQTLTEHWNGTAWSVVSSPNVGSRDNYLRGVTTISANDAWAVGLYLASNPQDGTLIEHWDGTSWTVVSSPNPSVLYNILTTVVASSANDVWAVGNTTGNNSEKSLVERWDGSAWSVVNSPNVGTSDNQLNGISLSPGGDVWSVGAYYADPLSLTLVEHFSAPCITPTAVPTNTSVPTNTATSTSVATSTSTSTSVPSATATPDPCGIVGSVVEAGAAVAYLQSVSALSANDVWAVGNYDTTGRNGTLIEHWNGTAWSIVQSPNLGEGNNFLFAVDAISINDVWAVGWYQSGNSEGPLAEHWDGASWMVSNLNISVDSAQLHGVGATAANDVWAVGGSASGTLVMHWNGTAWSLVPSPNVGTQGGGFFAISIQSANDIWAVGSYGSNSAPQTLTEHWDGTSWSIVQSPNVNTRANRFLGVSALSPNDVWAVGTYEIELYTKTLTEHWDGTSWTIVANPDLGLSSDYLWAIDGTSSSNVWAVGLVQYASPASLRTLLLHWDGVAWSVAPSPNTDANYNQLLGVSTTGDGELWAVGGYAMPFSDTHVLTEHFTSPCITPTVTPVGTSTSTPLPTQTAVGTSTQTATAMPTTSGSPTASPTACAVTFEDVQPDNWFYSYVQWMYCRGVISGYNTAPPCSVPGASCFKPQNNTTRGQVAKIVVLAFGYALDTSGGPHFSDVAQGSTFYDYVETARNKGLINGYADGTFRPNNNVTRAQVAKIAVLAAIDADPSGWTLLDPAVNTFEDVLPGSTFYRHVETAAAHSVLSGYPCGVAPAGACGPGNKPYFVPENNATRAQISKIVYLAVVPQR